MCSLAHLRWHVDEVFVKINGVTHYHWQTVDHDGDVLEGFVFKKRDRKAALKFSQENRGWAWSPACFRHGHAQVLWRGGE